MCGITGIWDLHRRGTLPELTTTINGMTDTLRHRGPDDAGTWIDQACGLALGHRRLSVLDLSQAGHQPMRSACGRYVITYNGEVYNFTALARELTGLGHSFRGCSDTEVMLAAITHWGLAGAVQRFVGMFAFALWDRQERCLHLVRDRLGIKPLTYGWVDGCFVFASELKAICTVPGFQRKINPASLPLFFRYGAVPSPSSIYQGLHALLPGTMLSLGAQEAAEQRPRIERYWPEPAQLATGRQWQLSHREAVDQLEQRLTEAIRLRFVADVPLGAFLSGGIDSSVVVALMQQQSSSRVKTFSIGFHEQQYNEAPHAAAIARHLGTDHTELMVTDREAMEVIPSIPEIYDEPFADSSQIPTYLVAALARGQVTVALTGDGGDELFGGYERYQMVTRDWQRRQRLPRRLQRLTARVARSAAGQPGSWPLQPLAPLLWLRGRPTVNLAERVLRRARLLEPDTLAGVYRCHAAFALIPDLEMILAAAAGPAGGVADKLGQAEIPSCFTTPLEQLMYLDLLQYLPDDILHKVDRASMAVSLETRVPMIDHRVVELSWQLPLDVPAQGGGKRLLRELLSRYVPRHLMDRPKMGFGVPYGEWLRGPLRDWAEALLSPAALNDSGIFLTGNVLQRWQQHLAGRFDHKNMLWPVLMYQAWRAHWRAS